MRNIKENSKDNAKIMAGLLRSGYTMLNLACPVCNNPLFRKKDNDILCPICNKKVIIKKEDDVTSDIKDINKSEYREKKIIEIDTPFNSNLNFLIGILEKKINIISQKLEQETQIDSIERYIKVLTEIFDFLNKLKNNNASAGI